MATIFDFARGRFGGGLSLHWNDPAPIAPVLRQVIEELRSSHTGCIIETDFSLDEPVRCDQTRLGQLFSNLLANALKLYRV